MKRKIVIALLSIMMLSFIGCGDGKPSEKSYTDNNGNRIVETERGNDITLETIPADLIFNKNTVSLADTSLYYSIDGAHYNVFATVTIDTSALSDFERLSLQNDAKIGVNDKILNVTVYMEDLENAFDFSQLTNASYYDDGNGKLIYFFFSTNHFKKVPSNATLAVYIDLEQEDTYTTKEKDSYGYTETTHFKVNKYHYYPHHDDKKNFKPKNINEMPPAQLEILTKIMTNYASSVR